MYAILALPVAYELSIHVQETLDGITFMEDMNSFRSYERNYGFN